MHRVKGEMFLQATEPLLFGPHHESHFKELYLPPSSDPP